jgi:hypothetical protein
LIQENLECLLKDEKIDLRNEELEINLSFRDLLRNDVVEVCLIVEVEE